MNNKDRADSSVTTYRPDAGQYQKKSYYSYDAEGFLISQQDTRYQLYNGSVYRDTVTSSFTISNGNISKISSSYYGGELIFEYSSLPRPANVPFLYGPAGVFTINGNPELLGRQSKNLESGSAFSPNGIMYNYTYTVDANGLITKMVQSKKGTGEFINSAGFQYNCR
jgi:hypothetical protein